MIVNDWAELAFERMALAPAPTWEHYLGAWSPRGSASVATLVRRMAYGGRKGRRAGKRLMAQVRGACWTVGVRVDRDRDRADGYVYWARRGETT